MSKRQYTPVTHIDTSNQISSIRPLCGSIRLGDGFMYQAESWPIAPGVTCPQCLAIGKYYSQGFSAKEARRIVKERVAQYLY